MGGESHRKREWRGLNDGYRREYDSFLRRAKDAVWSVDSSSLMKKRTSRRGAPVRHDVRALVTLLLFKVYFGGSYRWMESYLKGEPSVLKLLELEEAPSYETIRRCMHRIDLGYLYDLNERVTGSPQKSAISR